MIVARNMTKATYGLTVMTIFAVLLLGLGFMALCQMNALDHISAWQQTFTASVQNGALILFALILSIFLVIFPAPSTLKFLPDIKRLRWQPAAATDCRLVSEFLVFRKIF